MSRTLIWVGAASCVASGAVLLLTLGFSGQPAETDIPLGSLLGPVGFVVAGLLFAAGLTMIGLGSGRWKRPRREPHQKV